jgi:uroporphyrinogen-III synthase
MKKILLTRIKEDAKQTAKQLAELGFAAEIYPLAKLEYLQADLPEAEIIITTSQNSLRAAEKLGADFLKTKKLYVIGKHSAALAEELGYENITIAQNNVASLEQLILANEAKASKILYLAGRDLSCDLQSTLIKQGFESVAQKTIYQINLAETLPNELRQKLENQEIDAAMFFSKRSAENFIKLTETLPNIKVFCLSKQIAEIFKKAFFQKVYYSASPCNKSLLALLAQK